MKTMPRKLMALDAEDLQVISAHCQDAVLKQADMKFLPTEKRFVIEMNRFSWERGEKQNTRLRSVLHFERVERVAAKGIDPAKRDTVLSLLAIIFNSADESGEGPEGEIDLVFSGNATIRLGVECIEAQLADMNAAWAASSMPRHSDI